MTELPKPYMRTDNGLTVFERYDMTRSLPAGGSS